MKIPTTFKHNPVVMLESFEKVQKIVKDMGN